MKAVFDEYGESYDEAMKKSIGFMGQSHDFFVSYKAACIVDILNKALGDTKKLHVLDVGCGVGKTDGYLSPWLASVTGVDVSPVSIERARRLNPHVRYESYDGKRLPFTNELFDAAFLICVLHHVALDERITLLQEVRRILKPGGIMFVFEHNPFNPMTQIAVMRCAFDKDACLLSRSNASRLLQEAHMSVFEQRYILVFPFRLKWLNCVEEILRNVAVGAQYYVAGKKC